MNVTTADIQRYHKELSLAFAKGSSNSETLTRYANETKAIEDEWIGTKSSICPLKEVNVLNGAVDFSKLAKIKDSEFYNYDVMRAVGCAVDGVTYGLVPRDGNIAALALSKDSLRNVHRIGSSSVFGDAFTADIDGVPGMLVVKAPKPDMPTDQTHELFVGLAGVNDIRKLIPGLAVVLKGLRCAAPDIDPVTGKILSLCSSSNDANSVPYVVYESIFPSVSVKKFITTATVPQFHSMLAQAIFTSQTAYLEIGFTHYDLHWDNVLIRTLEDMKGEFCIRYQDYRTKQDRFVSSGFVVTYIDYGMSVINYNGRSMSTAMPYLMPYGVKVDPNPLYDIYKLMMFCALALVKDQRNPVFVELSKIFRFFNQQDDFVTAIDYQEDYLYALPYNGSLTLYDLLDYIEANCNVGDVITSSPTKQVLECTSCHTFYGALKDSLSSASPETFFEFYDLATKLRGSPRYSPTVRAYDYARGGEMYLARVDEDVGRLKDVLMSLKPVAIPSNGTADMLASKALVGLLSTNFTLVITAVSLFEDITLWLKVGTSVATLYKDDELLQYIDSKMRYLRDTALPLIQSQVITARDNYRTVRKIIYSGRWAAYESRYPWYTTVFTQVVYLIDRVNADKQDVFNSTKLEDALPEVTQPLSDAARDTGLHPANPRAATSSPANPQQTVLPPSNPRPSGLLPANPRVASVRDSFGNISDVKVVS